MSYSKQTWVNGESPLSAERMNYIETGIKSISDSVDENTSKIANLSNFATPEMFGAKGNGVADDTTAITNCFNSGYSKIIFGKNKIYKITSAGGITIPSNTDVNLNGSTIKLFMTTNNVSFNILKIKNQKNVKLHNGSFTTNYSEIPEHSYHINGVALNGAQHCELYDLNFSNIGGSNQTDGHVQIALVVEADTTQDTAYNSIHDCKFDTVYDMFNVRIISQWNTNYNYENHHNTVYNCEFVKSVKSCVEICGNKTHDCIVDHCIVKECGTEAMDIDKNAYNSAIRNIHVYNCIGSDEVPNRDPYGGFSVQSHPNGTGYFAHDNVIENCIIDNTVGTGFLINGGVHTTLRNNVVRNAAYKGVHVQNLTKTNGTLIMSSGTIENLDINSTQTGIYIIGGIKLTALGNEINSTSGLRISDCNSDNSMFIVTDNNIKYKDKGVIITNSKNVNVNNNLITQKETGASYPRGIMCEKFDTIRVINNTFSGDARCAEFYVVNNSELLVITGNDLGSTDSDSVVVKPKESGAILNVLSSKGNSKSVTVNSALTVAHNNDL